MRENEEKDGPKSGPQVVQLNTLKVEKAEGHRALYANHCVCVTSSEDVRLVFLRVAAHNDSDSKIYQEVDVYMSPVQAVRLHSVLGRQIAGWQEKARLDLAEVLAYDTQAPISTPQPEGGAEIQQ